MRQPKKNRANTSPITILLLCCTALLLTLILIGVIISRWNRSPENPENPSESTPKPTESSTAISESESGDPAQSEQTDPADTNPSDKTLRRVVSYFPETGIDVTIGETIPVNFKLWQSRNPDIYAWITVPNSPINYPIFQSPTNDEYYLTHNEWGYYIGGAIFSQRTYNSTRMNDRVTMLYGHRMGDNSLFTSVQDFSDALYFEQHRNIIVYLPDVKLTYEVFAAFPYSNMHIMYAHNFFYRAEDFNRFFQYVMNLQDLRANRLENYSLDYMSSKVIGLSTCLKEDSRFRYIVMGKLVAIGVTDEYAEKHGVDVYE